MDGQDKNRDSWSGPFGMGWQGWLVTGIIIVVTAVFAATRNGWQSRIIAALVPPLILFPLISFLSRFLQRGPGRRDRGRGPGEQFDLMTFLARTNPFMFLLLGAFGQGTDDARYQELLQSGPYGMGPRGYLILFILFLTPLILALIILAVTGQLPLHSSAPFVQGLTL
jgi:hypothetical protein